MPPIIAARAATPRVGRAQAAGTRTGSNSWPRTLV